MRIDIVADVICPWCFIGKRRLETALAQRPAIAPDITWRPFQLNPDMPAEGMPREAYLAAKFGGQAHAKRINQAAVDAGNSVGIPFAFEKIQRTPNTLATHRMGRFVPREGRATELVDRLFAGYFIEGRDIGNSDVLAAIAGESGLAHFWSRQCRLGNWVRFANFNFLAALLRRLDTCDRDRNRRRHYLATPSCLTAFELHLRPAQRAIDHRLMARSRRRLAKHEGARQAKIARLPLLAVAI